MVRAGILLLSLIALAACDEQKQTIPVYTVSSQTLNIQVPAYGELESYESQVIASPGQQVMVIDWLAEEYKEVKEGELIAVFDGEQISLQRRKEELAMMLIEKDIKQKYGEKQKQEFEVSSEKQLVSQEFDFAKSFNVDDLRIYSQLEIIDSMQNTEFLEAKDSFLNWKQTSVTQQSDSAVEVLDIRRKGHEQRFNQHQEALVKLEVRAPYAGLLVYQQNWRGEKPSIGQSVFPGDTIARLPNLDKMQAKLFVLDKEAIGLEVGQEVEMSLDAVPDKTFTGSVKSVASFSRTIQRGDPAKYFELVVELAQTNNSLYVPGRKLKATIKVGEKADRLLIPLQTIDNQDGQSFVYVKKRGEFVRQNVTLGNKNLYFVEVTQGLTQGDEIALSQPRMQG